MLLSLPSRKNFKYEHSKEIWDKLVVTYEGTSQVKETNINILMHQYEMFKIVMAMGTGPDPNPWICTRFHGSGS